MPSVSPCTAPLVIDPLGRLAPCFFASSPSLVTSLPPVFLRPHRLGEFAGRRSLPLRIAERHTVARRRDDDLEVDPPAALCRRRTARCERHEAALRHRALAIVPLQMCRLCPLGGLDQFGLNLLAFLPSRLAQKSIPLRLPWSNQTIFLMYVIVRFALSPAESRSAARPASCPCRSGRHDRTMIGLKPALRLTLRAVYHRSLLPRPSRSCLRPVARAGKQRQDRITMSRQTRRCAHPPPPPHPSPPPPPPSQPHDDNLPIE